MVWVKPGTFQMGLGLKPPQGPARTVRISHGFFIDVLEVTLAEYEECVRAKACTASGVHGPPIRPEDRMQWADLCNGGHADRGSHPVNCVDQSQAQSYCHFRGKRLPSEAEWEYAARGTDGRIYPWGEGQPESCEMAVVSGLCPSTGTRPVGTRVPSSRSASGTFDMAGNVWEWVLDSYDPRAYETAPGVDPLVESDSFRGVLRGGSWDFARSHAKVTYRQPFDKREGHVSTGMRCVSGPAAASLAEPASPEAG